MIIEHNNIAVHIFCFVLKRLPSALIVDAGPRDRWPGIIKLPIESAKGLRFGEPLCSDGDFDGVCLH